jgi:hypothetical protein
MKKSVISNLNFVNRLGIERSFQRVIDEIGVKIQS